MQFAVLISAIATLLSTTAATWTPLPSHSQPDNNPHHHADELSSLSKRGAPALAVPSGYAVAPVAGAAVAGGYAVPSLGAAALAGVVPPYGPLPGAYAAAVPAVGSPLFGALPAQLARAPHYVPSVALASAPYLAKPAYATSAYGPAPYPVAAPVAAHAYAAKGSFAHPGLTGAYFG